MKYGFWGKILRVDLGKRRISIEEPSEPFYRQYLGGSALALYYLLREVDPKVDPLGPDNKLVFAASPLVGAPAPGLSRYTVAAKSPLTGGFGEAEAGGWLGPELKFAGFDAVIIEGSSERPVYLWITDGRAEIKDAQSIWGKDSAETREAIRQDVGDERLK